MLSYCSFTVGTLQFFHEPIETVDRLLPEFPAFVLGVHAWRAARAFRTRLFSAVSLR